MPLTQAEKFLARKRQEQDAIARQNAMMANFSPAPAPYARYGANQGQNTPLGKYTGAGEDGVVQPWKPTERRVNMGGRPYAVDEGEMLVTNNKILNAYGGPEGLEQHLIENMPGNGSGNMPRYKCGGNPNAMPSYMRGGNPNSQAGVAFDVRQGLKRYQLGGDPNQDTKYPGLTTPTTSPDMFATTQTQTPTQSPTAGIQAPTSGRTPVYGPAALDESLRKRYMSQAGGMMESERAAEAQRALQSGATQKEASALGAISDVSRRSALGDISSQLAESEAQRAEERQRYGQEAGLRERQFQEGQTQFRAGMGLEREKMAQQQEQFEAGLQQRQTEFQDTFGLQEAQFTEETRRYEQDYNQNNIRYQQEYDENLRRYDQEYEVNLQRYDAETAENIRRYDQEYARQTFESNRSFNEDVTRFNLQFEEDQARWQTEYEEDVRRYGDEYATQQMLIKQEAARYEEQYLRDNHEWDLQFYQEQSRYNQEYALNLTRYDAETAENIRRYDQEYAQNSLRYNQEFTENQRRFNYAHAADVASQALAAGDYENAAAAWATTGAVIDYSKMATQEARNEANAGLMNLAASISTGMPPDNNIIQQDLKRVAEAMGMEWTDPATQAWSRQTYNSLRLAQDPVYSAVHSIEPETMNTMLSNTIDGFNPATFSHGGKYGEEAGYAAMTELLTTGGISLADGKVSIDPANPLWSILGITPPTPETQVSVTTTATGGMGGTGTGGTATSGTSPDITPPPAYTDTVSTGETGGPSPNLISTNWLTTDAHRTAATTEYSTSYGYTPDLTKSTMDDLQNGTALPKLTDTELSRLNQPDRIKWETEFYAMSDDDKRRYLEGVKSQMANW